MPKKYLKNAAAVNAIPTPDGTRQVTWWDTARSGLGLRVSGRTGSKTWVFRTRFQGKRLRITLGDYPKMGPTEAREAADSIEDTVARGIDPRPRWRRRKAGQEPAADDSDDAPTFRALAEAVMASRDVRGSTRALRRSCLDNYLLPALGDHHPATIEQRDVRRIYSRIRADGKKVMANRVLKVAKTIFADPIASEYGVTSDPAAPLRMGKEREDKEARTFTEAEIKRLWKELAEAEPLTAGLFKLSFLTGQRIGQCKRFRWSEIKDTPDGAEWHVPAAAFKGKRRFLVPLSTTVVELLDRVREWGDGSPWVFPSTRERTAVCDYCSRRSLDCTHLNSHGPALRVLQRECDFDTPWTAHDFRANLAGWAIRPESRGGFGVVGEVVGGVLGHKPKTVTRSHYISDDEAFYYLAPQKRDLLERWGDFVRRTVGGSIHPPGRP